MSYRELTDDELKRVLHGPKSKIPAHTSKKSQNKLKGQTLVGVWWTGGMSGYIFEANEETDDGQVGFCDEGGIYTLDCCYTVYPASLFDFKL